MKTDVLYGIIVSTALRIGEKMDPEKFYKTSYGYEMRYREKPFTVLKILGVILLTAAFVVLCIFYNFRDFKLDIEYFQKTVLGVVLLFFIVSLIFHDRRIRIDLEHGRISFVNGINPFREEISVDRDKIRSISINCTITQDPESGESQIYYVDLIDNDRNAYNFYTSNKYDKKLIQFAGELSSMLNLPLEDTNEIEGWGYVYKKRII